MSCLAVFPCSIRSFLASLVLLACLFWVPCAEAEASPEETIRNLNNEWQESFFATPSNHQAEKFKALLPKIHAFKAEYPQRAEPLILEAITLLTLVSAEWSLNMLTRVNDARDLLVRSIDVNPHAMEAAAYITLGNLYFRMPGWPISFGNDDNARHYLEAAVRLYPDAVDSNYFLGDFWLNQDEFDKALPYLEKADKAPVRAHLLLSDGHIKKELPKALKAARNRENERGDFFSRLVPNFGE